VSVYMCIWVYLCMIIWLWWCIMSTFYISISIMDKWMKHLWDVRWASRHIIHCNSYTIANVMHNYMHNIFFSFSTIKFLLKISGLLLTSNKFQLNCNHSQQVFKKQSYNVRGIIKFCFIVILIQIRYSLFVFM